MNKEIEIKCTSPTWCDESSQCYGCDFAENITKEEKMGSLSDVNISKGDVLWAVQDFLHTFAHSPIVQDDVTQEYYFYDETWSDKIGPYDSVVEALGALIDYCSLIK